METREYLTAGVKNRYMNITLRCYVNEENAVDALDALLEDVETVLEDNSSVTYKDKLGVSQSIQQITIISIETDEGVLEPMGVGELTIEVRY
jgi:hypothetical protein